MVSEPDRWNKFWDSMMEGTPEKVIGRFVLAFVAFLVITACWVGAAWLITRNF